MPNIHYTVVHVQPFTHSPFMMLVERAPDVSLVDMVRGVLRELGERFAADSAALRAAGEIWDFEEMTVLVVPSSFPADIGGTLTIFRNDSESLPRLIVRDPGAPKPLPSSEHLESVCGYRKGEQTCAFLAAEEGGFCCAKGSVAEAAVNARLSAGSMRSKGDNCSGYPDFSPTA